MAFAINWPTWYIVVHLDMYMFHSTRYSLGELASVPKSSEFGLDGTAVFLVLLPQGRYVQLWMSHPYTSQL